MVNQENVLNTPKTEPKMLKNLEVKTCTTDTYNNAISTSIVSDSFITIHKCLFTC